MSAGKVNIPSSVADPSYRYKMSKMILKQESRLNGVKTNIWNLDEVAKDLRVPEEAIIKFMCAELGASKEKKSILKGQHNYETLLKTLDKFIERYLLCQKCKYPETTMYAKQKQLYSKCRACGHINQLDSSHRAGVSLLKELPKNMSEIDAVDTASTKTAATDDKSKKGKKDKEEQKAEEEEQLKGKDKAKKKKEETLDQLDEEQLALDSEEIVQAIEKVNTMAQEDASKDKFLEELKRVQISANFTNDYKYYILMCGLFNQERNIIKTWPKYEPVFLSLIENDGKIGIKHLLQAIIIFFIKKYPELAIYSGTFMKLLYDQEVFGEEFLIKWYNKKAKLDRNTVMSDRKAEKQFRDKIQSFINWLQSAEEEEEEGEEEEEEEDQKPSQSTKISSPSKPHESEAMKKQRELIEKQMLEQQQMIDAKKEEVSKVQAEKEAESFNKKNVLDIAVEDDFDVDEI